MHSDESPQIDIEGILYRFMLATYANSSKKKLLEFMRFDHAPGKFARLESMTQAELVEIYCRDMAAQIEARRTNSRRRDGEMRGAMRD